MRTTLHQVGAVKDAAVREARQGRTWIDGAVLARRRREALASLGEAVLELAGAGALGGLEDEPAIRRALDDIDELDQQIAEAEAGGGAAEGGVGALSGPARWRGRAGGGHEPAVWDPRAAAGDDDAVSALSGDTPWQAPGRDAEPTRVWRPKVDEVPDSTRVWRPDADQVPEPTRGRHPDAEDDAARPRRGELPRRRPVRQGGGIAFVEDEPRPGDPDSDDDLAEYMHEDDVPDPGER